MAPGAVDEPGILDRRYELLAGDRDRRVNYFLIRKHLNFSVAEWTKLPWWQQKLYADELSTFLAAEAGEEPPGHSGASRAAESDIDMAAMGFHVGGGG